MKKIFFPIFLVATGLFSCKKDYTCQCSLVVLGQQAGIETTLIENKTKSDAEALCNSFQNTQSGTGKENCFLSNL
jgi:hypothetical protein